MLFPLLDMACAIYDRLAALKKKRWKPTFRWTDEGEVMLHLITGGSEAENLLLQNSVF